MTDGKHVYCWFSSGVMAALDFDGKIVWRSEIPGELPKHYDGLINSPLLFEDTVIRIVNVDQAGGNGVVQALEKNDRQSEMGEKTGQDRAAATPRPFCCRSTANLNSSWPAATIFLKDSTRPTARRSGHSNAAWGTCRRFTPPACSSPTLPAARAWPSTRPARETSPRPRKMEDRQDARQLRLCLARSSAATIFTASHKPGILHCWKLSTGELMYTERLDGLTNLASPISTADGRVYFLSSATSYIIKAGPKLEVLAKNDLGGYNGNNGPSPAIANGRLYVRDADPAGPSDAYLYCIGNK